VGNPDLTRYFALAAAFYGGAFSVAADLRADFGLAPTPQLAYHFGGEYVFGGSFPIRVGYMLDTIVSAQQLSVGLGYYLEGGSAIDLSYRHELGGTDGRLISLTVRMAL
jgi:hypothetical protein